MQACWINSKNIYRIRQRSQTINSILSLQRLYQKKFGLTWGVVTEAGQVVVGDDIKINCEVQLIKQG